MLTLTPPNPPNVIRQIWQSHGVLGSWCLDARFLLREQGGLETRRGVDDCHTSPWWIALLVW